MHVASLGHASREGAVILPGTTAPLNAPLELLVQIVRRISLLTFDLPVELIKASLVNFLQALDYGSRVSQNTNFSFLVRHGSVLSSVCLAMVYACSLSWTCV